ncbi:MAG: hypothetical protein ACON3Z_01935 [Bradymonadia bacterium]
MNKAKLLSLLSACTVMEEADGVFKVVDTATVDVLLKAGSSGPAPLSRIQEIALLDDFVQATTEDSVYLFEHDSIFGLKWKDRGQKATRTGFHA